MVHYNFAQHQQPPQVLLLVCKLYRVQRSKTPPQLFTVDVLKRAVLYHAQDNKISKVWISRIPTSDIILLYRYYLTLLKVNKDAT